MASPLLADEDLYAMYEYFISKIVQIHAFNIDSKSIPCQSSIYYW